MYEMEALCTDAGHDSLAIPLDSDENDFIFALSLPVWDMSPVGNYSIRLGGTDEAVEDMWVDHRTGLPMTYFNWGGSEPNNSPSTGGEDCINMIGDISLDGLWQDLACTAPSNVGYAWACETR